MMIEAILFDLDETLLGNNMETFGPGYFALLAEYAQPYLDTEPFLKAVLSSTQMMMVNKDRTAYNRDVFWHHFEQRTGLDRIELEPFFEQFYQTRFPRLAGLTQRRQVAAELVQACMEMGFKVVIATNPVFPRTAVEERLAWAGVPAREFEYQLVTSYENMHATKPHQAYYVEILEKIECTPEAALMVGDDWKNDIVPAAGLGLRAYWINGETSTEMAPRDNRLLVGHGSLADLYSRIRAGWLQPRPSSSEIDKV